jgi:polyisoprenoid-binding protein YceI
MTKKSSSAPKILFGIVSGLLLLGVGVPFVYTHIINGPEKHLSFDEFDKKRAKDSGTTNSASTNSASTNSASTNSAASTPADDLSGSWTVGEGSEIAYRVKEVIAGQKTEGVGKTSQIEGSVAVSGDVVTSAEFSVDVATLKSNSAKRDSQFVGPIMNAEEFPIASFVATSKPPIAIPPDGSVVTVPLNGLLTIHGVEKQVAVRANVRWQKESVQIEGVVPVRFADYEIANPSVGPISTGDSGVIEFLLVLRKS